MFGVSNFYSHFLGLVMLKFFFSTFLFLLLAITTGKAELVCGVLSNPAMQPNVGSPIKVPGGAPGQTKFKCWGVVGNCWTDLGGGLVCVDFPLVGGPGPTDPVSEEMTITHE